MQKLKKIKKKKSRLSAEFWSLDRVIALKLSFTSLFLLNAYVSGSTYGCPSSLKVKIMWLVSCQILMQKLPIFLMLFLIVELKISSVLHSP